MEPPAKGSPPEGADEYLRGQRRIALLFEVLDRARASAAQQALGELPARVMRVVARHAGARHEFERHRKRLAEAGKTFDLREVFDLVASELPGWCPWLEARVEKGVERSGWGASVALGRLVTNDSGSAERAKRFAELAGAATRLLARGSLGRAASAIAEAERLASAAAVPQDAVESARAGGFDVADLELFRPFVGMPGSRACLREVLRFFRRLQPVPLLQALAVEERQERRHLILVLLEAHGEPVRREALDLLRSDIDPLMSDAEAVVRRNLIYLLRRVPRRVGDGLEEEVAILALHAEPHNPPVVVKEAIGALSQLAERRAEQALMALRQTLQSMPSGSSTDTVRPEDVGVYLERVTTALTRRESASKLAARTVPSPSASETSRLSADVLPGLLHELAETRASGSLLVEDSEHQGTALLSLREGWLASVRAGSLTGADALFTLLETFEGGKAVWSPQPEAALLKEKGVKAFEVRKLVLEGLRRRDERELARAIVPDESTFTPLAAALRSHPDETDGLLTKDVWDAAAAGRSPRSCEKLMPVDPFRVRRLYLRWVEDGALEEVV